MQGARKVAGATGHGSFFIDSPLRKAPFILPLNKTLLFWFSILFLFPCKKAVSISLIIGISLELVLNKAYSLFGFLIVV